MSLLAPRDGIFFVGDFWRWGPEGPRKLQPGDRVWPAFPVGKIPDPAEMEVQAKLAEPDHGKIQPGMKARCVLDTYPDRVFDGTVEEVGSVTTQSGPGWDRTKPGFPVRVSLERTDPLMRPGLSVRVEVVRGAWDDALVVPRGAVRFSEGGPVVRRKSGGDPVPVTLAACTPTECVVDEGLEEGDSVSRF
jgi:HlyD family secretion protein